MANCWKCKKNIGFFEKKTTFIERSTNNKIHLHNECYLNLNKYDMKLISYNIKYGPPRGLRKNLKLTGFAISGPVGVFGYSEGAFSGAMSATKKILKDKGMSYNNFDDFCIDKYGYHYPILPEKLQNEILVNIRDNK